MIIKIADIVSETHSNASGVSLFYALENVLNNNDIIVNLSFEDISCPSTSFLNSSIGTLIEKHGIDILKRVKPTKVTKTQADLLRIFVASVSKTI